VISTIAHIAAVIPNLKFVILVEETPSVVVGAVTPKLQAGAGSLAVIGTPVCFAVSVNTIAGAHTVCGQSSGYSGVATPVIV
jgi:hypothetical protein